MGLLEMIDQVHREATKWGHDGVTVQQLIDQIGGDRRTVIFCVGQCVGLHMLEIPGGYDYSQSVVQQRVRAC